MSDKAKQGGNKKTSGGSSANYWARAKAGGYATTHRARRIKQHEARGFKANSTVPDFPHIAKARPIERVVDRSNVTEGVRKMHIGTAEHPGAPLYQGFSAGVLVEQGFSLSSVNAALDGTPQERHVYIQHPTGRRELLSFTPCK